MTTFPSPDDQTISWLLDSSPWVAYRTRVDLLQQAESDPQVQTDRQAMLAHPLVKQLIENVATWPGTIVNTHRKADLLMHQLVFLADLGVNSHDEGIPPFARKLLPGSLKRDHLL